jgi:hypothetical protein
MLSWDLSPYSEDSLIRKPGLVTKCDGLEVYDWRWGEEGGQRVGGADDLLLSPLLSLQLLPIHLGCLLQGLLDHLLHHLAAHQA